MPEAGQGCLACGACCFSKLTNYVRVNGSDHARMGDEVDALTHFDGNRCYMNMHEEHCAALIVDRVTLEFVCSIYARRPDTCRDLERQSPACRGEIHEKGERPLLLLTSLLTRR